jgi:putative membrane protein
MRSSTVPRRFFVWPFIGFLVIIGLVLAASLVAYAFRGPGGFFFFPFGFGWAFFFLFFLFFWGMRWWGGWGWGWRWYGRPYGGPYGWHQDDAHQILRARYARGEITKDQFEQMMRDLEQHS